MDLTWGTLGEQSLEQWADLTNVLAKVDETDEFYNAEQLGEELAEPGVTPALDTVAAWVEGRLVGYGQLRVSAALFEGRPNANLGGGVHPDCRGRGIGRQLMDRLEQRGRELGAERHPGTSVMLKASGGIEGASIRPLLEHRGYELVRNYHEMERPLPGRLPFVEPGAAVQPFSSELSERVRLAHNEAFASHWGSTEVSPERWQATVGSSTFRPDSSFVSVGTDGGIDSYVIVDQWLEGEAWIDLVGTRPSARGHGLARSLLSLTLRTLAEQGYRKACLGVDTQNGQNAGSLYTSLGFEVVRRTASYGKIVPPL